MGFAKSALLMCGLKLCGEVGYSVDARPSQRCVSFIACYYVMPLVTLLWRWFVLLMCCNMCDSVYACVFGDVTNPLLFCHQYDRKLLKTHTGYSHMITYCVFRYENKIPLYYACMYTVFGLL